jgi:hypothetical protein
MRSRQRLSLRLESSKRCRSENARLQCSMKGMGLLYFPRLDALTRALTFPKDYGINAVPSCVLIAIEAGQGAMSVIRVIRQG